MILEKKLKKTRIFRSVSKLESAVDAAEQYSRRNCLRISGMKEGAFENTDTIVFDIVKAIGVDLDIRHRQKPSALQAQHSSRATDKTSGHHCEIL